MKELAEKQLRQLEQVLEYLLCVSIFNIITRVKWDCELTGIAHGRIHPHSKCQLTHGGYLASVVQHSKKMSSYGLTAPADHQFATNFDKVTAYQNALQNSKANFSVSHLLDLEELPAENCAMYGSPDAVMQGQTCSPSLNGNSENGLTDDAELSPARPSSQQDRNSSKCVKLESCRSCSVFGPL